VNPTANVKAPQSIDPVADESPKKESELRQILGIFVLVLLMNYLPKRFSNWFGLSNPSAFALAILSAWMVSTFVWRPRKLFGFFEPKRPILTEFLVVAAIALVAYLVTRAWHF
jgi:hypothetical protein